MKNSLQICKAVYSPKRDRVWSIGSLGQGCIHFLEHNMRPGEMTCGRREILEKRITTLWNGNNVNLRLFCEILALWIKDSQKLFIHFYKWNFVKGYESDFNQNSCVALKSVCGLGRSFLKSYTVTKQRFVERKTNDSRMNDFSTENEKLWKRFGSYICILCSIIALMICFMVIYSFHFMCVHFTANKRIRILISVSARVKLGLKNEH